MVSLPCVIFFSFGCLPVAKHSPPLGGGGGHSRQPEAGREREEVRGIGPGNRTEPPRNEARGTLQAA